MGRKPKKRGVYYDSKQPDSGGGPPTPDNLTDKVADYSYSSDALAQLIVDMWLGNHDDLLEAPAVTDYAQRSLNAQTVLAARGIYLEKPIVITEAEYEAGFSLADAGLLGPGPVHENIGVVFVLPRKTRATLGAPPPPPPPLLETAKMLMAITPNGI